MVSFFWKMLGRIGAGYYYNRETKVSLPLFGAMHHVMIDTIAELSGNDYEQGMDTLVELVRPSSEEIITGIIFETKVLGVEWKSLIERFKGVKEFAFLLDLTLATVWGKKWVKKIFEKTRYLSADECDEKVDTYIIRLKKCPFCYPTSLSPERLGAHRFGKFLTLTIQQMTQIIQNFLENDFEVIARETRCFHQGDPFGELRLWLYPRDQLSLKAANPYIQQIK